MMPGELAEAWDTLGIDAREVARNIQENEVARNLYTALRETREEPGLSIDKVAKEIVKVFDVEEAEALIAKIVRYTALKIQDGNF